MSSGSFGAIMEGADSVHKNLESSIQALLDWQDNQRKMKLEEDKFALLRRQAGIENQQAQQKLGMDSIGQLAALRGQAMTNARGRSFRNSALMAIGG